MSTETIDKLYLEWSQFTKARNAREIAASKALHHANVDLSVMLPIVEETHGDVARDIRQTLELIDLAMTALGRIEWRDVPYIPNPANR